MTLTREMLTVPEMYEADRLAIEGGVPGLELMEAAGQGITAHMEQAWDPCPVLVLCGPGNNGGDGYVVARILKQEGWPVTVAAWGDPSELTGDAADMFGQWDGDTKAFDAVSLDGISLVVDALFGAGFRGDLPEDVKGLFHEIAARGLSVVAVDVPSGMNGTTGWVAEGTQRAEMTVSFFRPKVGHMLLPGREYLGKLEIVDIGIPPSVLDQIKPQTWMNGRELWTDALPFPEMSGHKYSRGHAAVVGGGVTATGAARIAARACLRSGAGAVTVAAPPAAVMTYSITLEAVMLASLAGAEDFANWLDVKRINAVLIGPGNGVTDRTRDFVVAALASDAAVTLDADALTVFRDTPDHLFSLIKNRQAPVILTPHGSEFERLFDVAGSAVERARAAALQSGAVVLLKGASTVVAAPDGRARVNVNAPPWLATAGSGDTLAGIITGLVAGGMPAFDAASAGAWIHGEAGALLGPGMIAEDLEAQIPAVLAELQ
ncbi:NAD(P)H-hydrate dehydratase [Sneathiella chinensis]|uniref:Bifunctional NAD(P)H-hydrate repair enzyme n=1 Tax=Sneathiella chinensis TaxID=349750 RepID=A0ABQ5U5G3_9PROT|nr:NAD(P)H-hydrate dehydratase [Sneathiella chinensis]GLQ07154.1 bifunctional NAD(P)H-hydrate repair enzyme [Sneathiella chinensis]